MYLSDTGYNKGFVLDNLFCRTNGLLSVVGAPDKSLKALYMYCCNARPAAASASVCRICTTHKTITICNISYQLTSMMSLIDKMTQKCKHHGSMHMAWTVPTALCVLLTLSCLNLSAALTSFTTLKFTDTPRVHNRSKCATQSTPSRLQRLCLEA